MKARGLARSDYGRVSVSQRAWAAANPGAVYRERLTLEEYLAAPFVADPLVRYDCVPVVSGADAVVVTGAPAERAVEIKAFRAVYNHDNQLGGGLELGLAQEAPGLWDEAGFGPEDVDVVSVYDDYPAMVLIQLDELGLVPGHDSHAFVARLERCRLPVNTSGGQLSAGQAGASASVGGGRGDRLLDGPRLVACRC
jgi:acetyl-CoA acetyltransferase